jgi:hypothetical protein
MKAYLDAGFLLTTIIPITRGRPAAQQILREIDAPCTLNFLHQLQVENLLVSLQTSAEKARETTGNDGRQLWRNYFSEGVFQLMPADWDSAFRAAINWNNQHVSTPPPFLLMLHPALAAVAGATHFASFDPRSRAVARSAGMELLPENL